MPYTITCTKCSKSEEIKAAAQPGQNHGHFICNDCQSAYDKSVQKSILDTKAPTLSLDGRSAQTTSPAKTK